MNWDGLIEETKARLAAKEKEKQEAFDNWDVGDGKLDSVLAEINQRLYREYEEVGIPAEERLFDAYRTRDTTESAMKDAIKARRLLGEVDDRNASRYGVSKPTGAEAGYDRTQKRLGNLTTQAGAFNDAKLADEDFKLNTLQTLIGQGNRLRNAAQGGLGSAASGEANRDMAYQNAKTQARGNKMNLLGTGLGIAAALAF